MIDLCKLIWCTFARLFRSRAELEAEILVLRHQLNVLRRKSPGRLAFSSIDRFEPGCGGRGEVEGPAGMAGKPGAHLGMFVGGIVVDDGVDHLSLRHLRLEVLRKRMNS